MTLKKGLYEHVLTILMKKKLENLDEKLSYETDVIDKEASSIELSNYLQKVIKDALDQTLAKASEKLEQQIIICNEIINTLSELNADETIQEKKISDNGQMVLAIYEKIKYQNQKKIPRTEAPMNRSSIFTGSSSIEPSMVSELKKEIKSADEINLLVSFIRWSGVRQIIKELEDFTKEDNHKLRIITTTYLGATEVKAIKEIAKLRNTEIKISYDTNRTRLHAKVYMFQRATGFSTAYIGSSNLSNIAISSGLEWNIKISEYENKDIFEKCIGTFYNYWNDLEFKTYRSGEEDELTKAINAAKILAKDYKSYVLKSFKFDIKLYTFQEEILEHIEAERVIYNRNRNLIVAATGTGKTVISAFDYKRFCKAHPGEKNRLLFIAHRKEILEQSIDCYRRVLKDENFGDLWVGNYRPAEGHADYLFISIQSFNSRSIEELVEPNYFDYIIIDEFHHAAADSYQVILDYFKPKILLGLTATPERMDGKSIVDLYFNGHIAAEIRLKEAIDRKLLCPFQYFGVSDSTDLSKLEWSRGGYKVSDLEDLYVRQKGNTRRAEAIFNSVLDYAADIEETKGIGFCVSVEHAHFMADFFKKNGIASIALDAKSPDEIRNTAKDNLNSKKIHFVFVVDLYNEGIDIPDVNMVLFLRPTESLTIFLQQLGRGLRLSEGKDCLTVLDFVAQAHRNYKFAEKFRALTGKTRNPIEKEIENGFPNVPKGCYIELEKQAQIHILENIRAAINNIQNIRRKIQMFRTNTDLELTLKNFLKYYNLQIGWLYKSSVKNKGWNRLCVQSNVRDEFKDSNPDEEEIVKGIQRLTTCNSRRFLTFIKNVLRSIDIIDQNVFTNKEILMLSMFHYIIWFKSPKECGFENFISGITNINENPVMKEELVEVIDYNLEQIQFVDRTVDLGFPCPLDLHCRYTTDQILAALGYYTYEEKKSMREGVLYLKEKNCEILFITLNKSEKDYSPSTLYHDYSINEKLFHWQTQSTIGDHTATGQRYIKNVTDNYIPLIFIRKYKKENGQTAPYYYLGPVRYKSHKGNRPMNIIWELENQIPAFLVKESNKFSVA